MQDPSNEYTIGPQSTPTRDNRPPAPTQDRPVVHAGQSVRQPDVSNMIPPHLAPLGHHMVQPIMQQVVMPAQPVPVYGGSHPVFVPNGQPGMITHVPNMRNVVDHIHGPPPPPPARNANDPNASMYAARMQHEEMQKFQSLSSIRQSEPTEIRMESSSSSAPERIATVGDINVDEANPFKVPVAPPWPRAAYHVTGGSESVTVTLPYAVGNHLASPQKRKQDDVALDDTLPLDRSATEQTQQTQLPEGEEAPRLDGRPAWSRTPAVTATTPATKPANVATAYPRGMQGIPQFTPVRVGNNGLQTHAEFVNGVFPKPSDNVPDPSEIRQSGLPQGPPEVLTNF